MEITPDSKFARIQALNHTFRRLTESYRQKEKTIAWAVDKDEVAIDPDYLWEKYAQLAGDVRSIFMFSTETRIDRHKIIALTERVILEVQPLVFVGDGISSDEHYRLNAEYAFLFALQFLTRWNEVYHPDPFYPDQFVKPLHTEKGAAFCREHAKLLCVKSPQPFPVFWASQLWFLLEQWGLEYMEKVSKYPPQG